MGRRLPGHVPSTCESACNAMTRLIRAVARISPYSVPNILPFLLGSRRAGLEGSRCVFCTSHGHVPTESLKQLSTSFAHSRRRSRRAISRHCGICNHCLYRRTLPKMNSRDASATRNISCACRVPAFACSSAGSPRARVARRLVLAMVSLESPVDVADLRSCKS